MKVSIQWPNGKETLANKGDEWLKIAMKEGINIPTGCLSGSCGSCEIEVNGEVIRACISVVEEQEGALKVDFFTDSCW